MKRHHYILQTTGSCDKYHTEFARLAAHAIWTHISELEAFPLMLGMRWDADSLQRAGNVPISFKLASVQEYEISSEIPLIETGIPCWL